ncbi:unnamed protein product [Leptosia nina]|uniref:Uncharacterized protein n=1 Tax=Leptosia nina TaxID=320188 RepID=A0AAV1IT80_9NEOP
MIFQACFEQYTKISSLDNTFFKSDSRKMKILHYRMMFLLFCILATIQARDILKGGKCPEGKRPVKIGGVIMCV